VRSIGSELKHANAALKSGLEALQRELDEEKVRDALEHISIHTRTYRCQVRHFVDRLDPGT
jgi:hypothetical protein